MKTTKKLILFSTSVGLALAASSHAANIMNDDFESYTVDGDLPTGGNWATATSSQLTIRDEGTQTPFGSPNQYLEWDDQATSTVGARTSGFTAASNVVSTISFDFFERDVTNREDRFKVGYGIDGGDITSAARRQAISFDNGVVGSVAGGTSTSYSENTAYRVFMIFNDSAASVAYSEGTILAGDAHVWLRDLGAGTNTFAGISSSELTGTAETSYNLAFRANGGSDMQFVEIDNVSFDTGVVLIPEPSVVMLGALGALGLLRRRR